MNTPLISVVIPVYNARKYLPFTLKNIVEDQFHSLQPDQWELIAVDDGSTDGSHLEIEHWIKKYPESVKLIRKPNGGPSSARNAGLAAACGDYVYFCDSDDILLRGALPRLLSLAGSTTPDLIKFHLKPVSESEYLTLSADVPDADISTDNVLMGSVCDFLRATDGMVGGTHNNVATCLTIYRRTLLENNNLRFSTELNNGEDEIYMWEAILHAKTVCFVPVALYIYNQRTDSISHPSDLRRQSAYDAERIRFVTAIQDILRRVNKKQLLDSATAELVADIYRHVFYLHLTSLIVNTKASLSTIYKSIKIYRTAGGKVFPGRIKLAPYYNPHDVSLHVKLRRIASAYVLDRIVTRQLNRTQV